MMYKEDIMTFKHTKTRENFIERANQIHNNKYSYDKVAFTPRGPLLSWTGKSARKAPEYNGEEKVIVTCPLHGDFLVRARKHIESGPSASGCKYCSWELRSEVRYDNRKRADFINCNKHILNEDVVTIYHTPSDGVERQILILTEDAEILKFSKWHTTGHQASRKSKTNYCVGDRTARMKSENLQWLGTKPKLHRLIMSRVLGRELKRSEIVDHINHNGLDNRRENLRIVTHSQNMQNSRTKARGGKASIYKGVTLTRSGRWLTYIGSARGKVKREYLGRYDTEEEAALAYDKKAKELFGEYANLNFPEEQ